MTRGKPMPDYSHLKTAANIAARRGDDERLHELAREFMRFIAEGDPEAIRDHNRIRWEHYLRYPQVTGKCRWPAELTSDAYVGAVDVPEDEPLTAWRYWSVRQGRLVSPAMHRARPGGLDDQHGPRPGGGRSWCAGRYSAIWEPGVNEADPEVCRAVWDKAAGAHPRANTDASCCCGIYAIQSATRLGTLLNHNPAARQLVGAVAQVHLWGRVASYVPIVDPPGVARAQFARITGPLYLTADKESQRARIEKHYGIEPGGDTLREHAADDETMRVRYGVEPKPPAAISGGQGGGWTWCADGHPHWGRWGGAGLLLVHDTARGPKYLLQHRSHLVEHRGTWGIPGGALNRRSEAPYAAAMRETEEETGDDLPELSIIGEHVADCGGWRYVTIVAAVDEPLQPDSIGWETGLDGWRWVTDRQARRMRLHPGLRAAWPELVKIR